MTRFRSICWNWSTIFATFFSLFFFFSFSKIDSWSLKKEKQVCMCRRYDHEWKKKNGNCWELLFVTPSRILLKYDRRFESTGVAPRTKSCRLCKYVNSNMFNFRRAFTRVCPTHVVRACIPWRRNKHRASTSSVTYFLLRLVRWIKGFSLIVYCLLFPRVIDFHCRHANERKGERMEEREREREREREKERVKGKGG